MVTVPSIRSLRGRARPMPLGKSRPNSAPNSSKNLEVFTGVSKFYEDLFQVESLCSSSVPNSSENLEISTWI